jgi:arsenate reductase
MESTDAVKRLSALAQDARLEVFRVLIKAGPEGLAAGEIARRTGTPANTMSAQLLVLANAGLVRARRDGRSIIYSVDIGAVSALLVFLTEDCCGGRSEICAPLATAANRNPAKGTRREAPARPRAGVLRARLPEKPYNVLFLCTGNSARSIFAEAILNRIGRGKFVAWSAGSHPSGSVNPHATSLLKRLGLPTAALRSKSWDEFATSDAPKMDFVFTVCDSAAKETCPAWPGQPMTAHWSVPDPAAASGDEITMTYAFRIAYRLIERRIGLFAALPVQSLDRLSLQARLDEIAKA